jgi:uncharacterized protein YjiS (DUF1127 family)
MSAHIADSATSFKLPSLSYVDTQWEEAKPRGSSGAASKTGLAAWLSRRVAAFVAWRRNNEALSELSAMSDRELSDIGISRSDVARVFDPAFGGEQVWRGSST